MPSNVSSHAASPFIGTWCLVSQHSHHANGDIIPSRGDNAAGVIMYDAHGNMAVQLMRTDDRAAEYTDLSQFSTAMEGYLAYFGRYEVDAAAGIIRHHVVGSSYFGYRGTVQERRYVFEGDILTLRAKNPNDGSERVLVWKRA
jgi:hypothetical protein